MPTFDDREKAFEAKYRQDQEFRFKVNARRNRLLGEWAAGLMGMTGVAVETYAKEVVASDFEKPGDDDMLGKVRGDFKAANIAVSDAELSAKLNESFAQAAQQISSEK